MMTSVLAVLLLFAGESLEPAKAFAPPLVRPAFHIQQSALYQSSFAADGSEYSSKDNSEFDDDDDRTRDYGRTYRDDQDETPTVELQPVPLSKNAGSRFVAMLWNRELDTKGRDPLDLHYDQITLSEDHVMFCRKANLYNETFNTESMVDVRWSFQMYVISHAGVSILYLSHSELVLVQSFVRPQTRDRPSIVPRINQAGIRQRSIGQGAPCSKADGR